MFFVPTRFFLFFLSIPSQSCNHTIVFTHYPTMYLNSPALHSIYRDYSPSFVLSGHVHATLGNRANVGSEERTELQAKINPRTIECVVRDFKRKRMFVEWLNEWVKDFDCSWSITILRPISIFHWTISSWNRFFSLPIHPYSITLRPMHRIRSFSRTRRIWNSRERLPLSTFSFMTSEGTESFNPIAFPARSTAKPCNRPQNRANRIPISSEFDGIQRTTSRAFTIWRWAIRMDSTQPTILIPSF